ncbi:hypothetical protein H257_15684 [Aphanomyces astaci]|uniref:Uncharacterized protein n=1 Tax=Aphanomyces astaci TaxID=112090 RepID=W4FNV0_APHAT|nr:hypothetical protein H257_15684 [Aphanomyces astaci]ETV68363.1 hypothetical protein H257_15684 [Aphanomyces astaci]|eukprot:XP_009842158.1 hypothetical protein H257_15684 [Aphanomyces astaci]
MMDECGFITPYTHFTSHVKAKHKHVRNIGTYMPGPSTKCNDAKPMFDPPGTRSLINQENHDIAIQLAKNNAVGVGALRLLLFVYRKLGGNPNELLQPFLRYRDDESGDFDDGEQPSGDDYGVDGDDNEHGGELVPPVKRAVSSVLDGAELEAPTPKRPVPLNDDAMVNRR